MSRNSFFATLIAFFLFSILTASIVGGVVGYTYPIWSQNLPFGLTLPQVSASDKKTITLPGGEKRVVTSEESAIINVVDKTSPSVVSVVAKTVTFQGQEQQGIGTGFIADKNGIILTNSHVVSDQSVDYTVVTKDKKNYSVKKISRDTINDIAILKVDATDLPALNLSDSNELKVGQEVVAIGYALGKFDNTVTTGVVSGLGRGVTASDALGGSSETLENVIQTDAALNPGNSGGPLLNLSGEVVGINVAVTQGAQNIGFAIPINVVKNILEGYQKEGRIVRPYMGVAYLMVDEEIAKLRNLVEGAFIQRVVPDGPADKAGVKAGDIITKIGDTKINSDNPLSKVILKNKVNDTVNLEVWRDGQTQTLKATLTEAPQD
ncbi:MAG: trypsin-like peptidase domain-containing protein [Patescibacteria group bacterium]|nr:trypsin-like peptidase domain-containing protein [Patescibacteria group bacterium]